jgi:hypothetical protein
VVGLDRDFSAMSDVLLNGVPGNKFLCKRGFC